MRIGLIGLGSIGSYIATSIIDGRVPGTELVAIADVCETPVAQGIVARCGCPFTLQVERLTAYAPDLIVEAASQDAARRWAPFFLQAGFDVMVVSVGALADADFLSELVALAESQRRRVYVPSGAIGGLDVLKAASVAGLYEVTLTTTKPPAALAGAAYVVQQGLDLAGLREPTVIYEGPAAEAVKGFPQNVNVAAALSLAGIGAQRTRVRIVADPAATRNIHEVYARGDFGEVTLRLVNLPSPANPKTSFLAPLSAVATLRRIAAPLQLGT